eukprot:3761432-Prymnesium_polylepis.1
MCHCADPYKHRTPLDIVACTKNTDFSNPGVAGQFDALARAWMNKKGSESYSQLFVGHSDEDSRE